MIKNFRSVFTITSAVLILTAPACDAPPDEAPASIPDHFGFRGGEYEAGYITEYQGAQDAAPMPIDFDRFVEALIACESQEPSLTWTMTLTRYKPDAAAENDRVVGFGGSTLSHGPAIECWEKVWATNGETLLP